MKSSYITSWSIIPESVAQNKLIPPLRDYSHDIPFCPTTTSAIPKTIITWDEAKAFYKKHLQKGEHNFHYGAYVCFYIDDAKFDGPRGIWHDCTQALKIIQHFDGAITPDFSTNQDFPEALKIYQTYRMRMFGYWLGRNGVGVINNVRWGTPESWRYCFVGIPMESIVAIGTVGGIPRKIKDRKRFESGLFEMFERLHPHTVIVYGSASYPCFDKLKEQECKIFSYQSSTAKAFERRQML